MPKLSKDSAAEHKDWGPVEEWNTEVDGFSIDFITFKVDMDSKPVLKGLPGDRCTCPHWGYVFKGKVTYTFDDHDEIHQAGDAFYVPAGHLQRVEAGTEYLQFSPAEELRTVSENIERNFRQMQEA
jgi:mannose-6-phosphate isomerase-like protein (cupin superfamily)